ncbi:MAG: ribulose-phosphate 3-epimerase [bacterium]
MSNLSLRVGVKTDPIEYRFSYEWLFQLMSQEGIHHIQLGTFFEMFHLPDEYFVRLKRQAEDFGIAVSSVFSAHRELGGFFRYEPEWERVARSTYERLIDVGALVGAKSVGSNPGSVPRDRMDSKEAGVKCYLRHMKELMGYAHRRGVPVLTMEPMSCLAEPPTLPDEIDAMANDLFSYHRQRPDETAVVGYCVDVAHGYANRHGEIQWSNLDLFEASLPHLYEVHLKNTDERFESTFGFTPKDRERGIVQITQFRDFLLHHTEKLPVKEVIGYLEIGGPKLGRDYSDHTLESDLRESLRYLKATFLSATDSPPEPQRPPVAQLEIKNSQSLQSSSVQIAPSIMCADLCNMEAEIRRFEAVAVDWLHIDLMDAHFVPNMPLGLEILRQLRVKTNLPFDVHLMVENNEFFIGELARIGVQQISIHAESAPDPAQTLDLIRKNNIRAGIALNPSTAIPSLANVLRHIDFVLVMTVYAGFAGQEMVPSGIQRIADCRTFLSNNHLNIPIQVDGNVSFENIPKMVAAGADILVGGTSSVFSKDGSLHQNMQRVHKAIAKGLEARKASGQTC